MAIRWLALVMALIAPDLVVAQPPPGSPTPPLPDPCVIAPNLPYCK